MFSTLVTVMGNLPRRPPASASGVPRGRLGYGRHVVLVQSVWHSLNPDDDVPLEPDAFRNQLEFEGLATFLATDETCGRFSLDNRSYWWNARDLLPGKWATDSDLAVLDVDALRALLPYVTPERAAMLAAEDFRSVNVARPVDYDDGSDDASFMCAVAGALSMDVAALRLVIMGERVAGANAKPPRRPDRVVLEMCRDGGLMDYYCSWPLHGLLELNAFLCEHAATLSGGGARLVLSQFDGADAAADVYAAGHGLALKYCMNRWPFTPDPQKVLIDFQLPPFVELTDQPHPLRFTTHVDTVAYDTFVVYVLYVL